jgi:hypothetical protein
MMEAPDSLRACDTRHIARILRDAHLFVVQVRHCCHSAAEANTASSATLKRVAVAGRVQLDGARCEGPLALAGLALEAAPAAAGAAALADPAVLLSLRGSRASTLAAEGLTLPATAVADLRGAEVALLSDQGGAAWGQGRLRLDGFSYARLAEPPAGDGAARRTRLGFLLRQYHGNKPGPADFSGQPFTQLAQALRHTGHAADADWFARARRRVRRPSSVSRSGRDRSGSARRRRREK